MISQRKWQPSGNVEVLLSVCFNALVQLPLASDVDFDAIAHMIEGFSKVDLQALLSDAQLQAVDDLLDSRAIVVNPCNSLILIWGCGIYRTIHQVGLRFPITNFEQSRHFGNFYFHSFFGLEHRIQSEET
ncbi:hypothetical protein EUGRSUZ_E01989 [Eucalyptus grandis]|uniref:Uncharacterized protein n=2 Tax=Eucalyptus grandis TaxID=71139 RepID=A0ACC3KVL8_EUCGR|nr:hypothetical protein EUGRSUZ_E01989 [Eucalyptus grandis]